MRLTKSTYANEPYDSKYLFTPVILESCMQGTAGSYESFTNSNFPSARSGFQPQKRCWDEL